MGWKLRIEHLVPARPGDGAGEPAAILGVQTLSGSGTTSVLSDPAPDFGLDGRVARAGAARVSVLRGAAVIAWGDAPVASEAAGLRLEAGRSQLLLIATGQKVAACEAADAPAGASVRTLLSNASATGAAQTDVAGGAYIWTVQGTFGGATVKLQTLGPDGTNWLDVASLTTAGSTGVVVGEAAAVRASVSGGTPAALYSTLS